MCAAYVYIMASKKNGTLYIGSTVNLIKRIWEHKNKITPGFTSQYQVDKLVYYEEHEDILNTGEQEKKFKVWKRKWKIDLIESVNPDWVDLFEEICF